MNLCIVRRCVCASLLLFLAQGYNTFYFLFAHGLDTYTERNRKLTDALIIRYGAGYSNGDIPLALKLFKELLEGPVDDDVTVQCWFEIGKIRLFDQRTYRRKKGNYTEVVDLFTRAAKRGHADARFYLSFLYTLESPKELVVDEKLSMKLLKQSAAQDHPPALVTLAYRYLYGIGHEKDISSAILLYKTAYRANAKKNEVLTQMSPLEELRLSEKALEPFRIPLVKKVEANERQRKEAIRYWEAKANAGDPMAMYELGKLMENEPASDAKMAKLYNKASRHGVLAATRDAGVCYMNGIGVPKNGEKALECLTKAVELGDPEAAKYLGYLYYMGMEKPEEGEPVKRSYKMAMMYLSMAAMHEIPEAMYLVGEILYTKSKSIFGKRSKKKVVAAFKMYRMAADYGLMQALAREAEMLEKGIGVKKNLFQAALNYKQLAEAPFTVSTITDSFNAYVGKDYRACFLYNALASYAGVSAAQYNIGKLGIDRHGLDVVSNSQKIVSRELGRCARQGEVHAYYLLGRLAENAKRFESAADIYTKGFKGGDLQCLDPLATLLGTGKETRAKAISLLEYKQYRMALDRNNGVFRTDLCAAIDKFSTWKKLAALRIQRAMDYYRKERSANS